MEPADPIQDSLNNLPKPWESCVNSVWLASTITLQRNIDKFRFPQKLELERKRQMITLAGKELLTLEQLKKANLFKAEDLSSFQKEYLAEHFLGTNSFHHATTGEAFVIAKSGQVMVQLNGMSHLLFSIVDMQSDMEGAWSQLVDLETSLGNNVNYAYSQKFGFLTADPAKCGTALSVSALLQLSGLIQTGKMEAVLKKSIDESFMVTGIQGNPNEIIGDLLMIQNNYTLGVTEENILSSLRLLVSALLTEESQARNWIAQSRDPVIMDKVSRAFAILVHSYKIEAYEALDALSLLKLGVEIGWVDGIMATEINNIFFSCRRAHLLSLQTSKVSNTEVPHKRAEFIHQALKSAKLLI